MRAILLAGALSLIFTLLGTRVAIRILVAKGYGQLIRDDGPTTHHTKRGTPTMGGSVIIFSVVLAYLVAKLVTWRGAEQPLRCCCSSSSVGSGWSASSTTTSRSSKQRSLGLRSKAKMLGQTLIAVVFAVLSLQFPDERGTPPASQAICRSPATWRAGSFPRSSWSLLIVLIIAGTSNAVNLTDGLDGLATGASVMVFGAYTLVNIWQNNQWCGQEDITYGKCYEVRDPLDLAIVCAAITGACFGFLWWNASPAKIFMGDTGSLSLGGALAGLAILTRTEFLLVILGGLFVTQTAVGDPAGRLLQSHRWQAHVPDGAAAPPLRAEGLGRDHRRDPVLDHHRTLSSPPGSASSTPSGWPERERSERSGRVLSRPGPEVSAHLNSLGRHDSWAGVRAVVAGMGVSGFAAADNLTHVGAHVTALDESDAGDRVGEGHDPRDPRCRRTPRSRVDRDPARRRRRAGDQPGLEADVPAAAAGSRPGHPDLGRGRAGLAAARPERRRPGSRSPAPTARPPRCRCSTRS